MGIPQPEKDFFKRGKAGHRVVQDHVAGIKPCPELEHITMKFPIVEVEDFDPKCRIEFKINDKYKMIGYFDGEDPENNRTLEIKTGYKMWSIGEFNRAIQRRIYSIAKPNVKENILITALGDMSLWKAQPPKIFSLPVTEKDKLEAWAWIQGGVERLENIGFWVEKELEVTGGKCTNPRCFWGQNCAYI